MIWLFYATFQWVNLQKEKLKRQNVNIAMMAMLDKTNERISEVEEALLFAINDLSGQTNVELKKLKEDINNVNKKRFMVLKKNLLS